MGRGKMRERNQGETRKTRKPWSHGDKGQVIIFVLIALGLFLIAFVGFAVDMTNLWFHRQAAQGAADAACQAGAMDMLLTAEGAIAPKPGFTAGTPVTCTSSSTAVPCQYAAFNGYRGGGASGTESNEVQVSFPASVPGAVPPPTGLGGAFPYMQVDVTDHVRVYFSSMLTRGRIQDVPARARCGLVVAAVPIPIIILNPTCPQTLDIAGNGSLRVVGGPAQSIQVNSCAGPGALPPCSTTGTAALIGTVDFSTGGPNFTGSNFGVFGGPATAPGSYNGGSTGTWISPYPPISDPFATVAPPPVPPLPCTGTAATPCSPGCPLLVNPCTVGTGTTLLDPLGRNGCPVAVVGPGCLEYAPGLYTSSIIVKNRTAIFDPGVYYITGISKANCPQMPNGSCLRPNGQCNYGLVLDSLSLVRPSTALGDLSGGTTFYFSGNGPGTYGSVFIGANSGGGGGSNPFQTSIATCPLGNPPDSRLNLPPTLTGNVLLGPCTGTYGSATGMTRGILFFDNRDNADLLGQPSMQGGGAMLLAGTMYFHNCASKDGAGLGTNCSQTTDTPPGYQAFWQLQGTPGSGTYILGEIVADDMALGGTARVSMALDPNAVFPVLRVSLLQ